MLDVTSAVSQGSVLGLLVFLLFLNDLASVSKSPSFFIADDVNVVRFTDRGDLSSGIGVVLN